MRADRLVAILQVMQARGRMTAAEVAAGFEVPPVAAPPPLVIARTLAGRGAAVRVEDPPEVGAELVRLGRELVTVNGA